MPNQTDPLTLNCEKALAILRTFANHDAESLIAALNHAALCDRCAVVVHECDPLTLGRTEAERLTTFKLPLSCESRVTHCHHNQPCAQLIDANGKIVADTLNAALVTIEREDDGEGGVTFSDSEGVKNLEYIAMAVSGYDALLAERDALKRQLDAEIHRCELCGERMPASEAAFKSHTYVPCPNRPESKSLDTGVCDSDYREVACVWCGYKFKSTIQYQADHLYEHAKTCEKHPIRILTAERDVLLARVERAEAWQTIESAPKDGTHFLANYDNGEMHVMYVRIDGEFYSIMDELETDVAWMMPTHWMALPSPPVEPAVHESEKS